MQISLTQAEKLIKQVLAKHGYTEREVEMIAEVLMYGVLRNSSQGFPKLFGWHMKKAPLAKEPEIKKTSNTTVRINANGNNGMYASKIALEEVLNGLEKESNQIAGVYNTYSTSSAIGYYTSELAKAGHIAIMFASADPIGGIGIKGSNKGIFGTNPVAMSVPYRGNHITLDMSTAKYTWADLLDKKINTQQLEKGFAYDSSGKSTTDPEKAMKGSVATFDGHYKGLGLAFMIQILAGALVGSIYEQNDETCGYGNLIIGINPKHFAGQDFINEQLDKLIYTYKNSTGKDEPFLPGEQGAKRMRDSLEKGSVQISEDLYEKIKNYLAE